MTVTTGGTTFSQACRAIEEVLPQLTQILRHNRGVTARAVGSWTLPEVACHFSHVLEKDTDAVARRPIPYVELLPAAVGVWTNEMLAADPERDLGVLAERIEALGSAFLRLEGTEPAELVTWVGGTQIPASAVACHLLEELLVHGYDVAQAANAPWQIEPAHAALAITGAALPIIAASPPSWIRRGRDPREQARVEVRLRGHERFVLDLGETLTVEIPPANKRADVYLSADPGSLLLVMLGRITAGRTVLTGKALAWGRRPLALFTLLRNITPP
jgi:hypothetical protein